MAQVRDISRLHPDFQPIAKTWLELCTRAGIMVLVTETWRSLKVQEAYYARGRKPYAEVSALYLLAALRPPELLGYKDDQTITNATPGRGWHPYGLAIDFVPLVDGQTDWIYNPVDPDDFWDEIAYLAKSLGMKWGGDWRSIKDRPHVEWHPGYSSSAQAKEYFKQTGEWKLPIPGPHLS